MKRIETVRCAARLGIRLAVFCVLSAMGSLAQRPDYPLQKTMTGPYRIAGVLVNAATGEPVRRATVEALDAADSHAVASCITDSEGRFTLEHLAAAKYQLTASKRGFRTAAYDEHDEFSSAIVTGTDQDTTHLDFKLTPNAVLRGVITDDAGEPVANARVMLFKRPKHPGVGERIAQVDGTATDDTGAYEFGNLAAGEYLLAVTAEPWYAVYGHSGTNKNPALDVAYPVTYYDSTPNEGSATPIALAGGGREEANISLHAVPSLHLSVALARGPEGTRTAEELRQNIFGTLINVEGVRYQGGDSRNGLTFDFSGFAPGHYELTQGDPPRVFDLDLASSQQLDPNAGTPANAIEGRVQMMSGAPVPEEIALTLEHMDTGTGQNQYATEAHGGRFRFEAVPPGQWAVWATSGDKALPVVAVSTGGPRRAGNVVTLQDRTAELLVSLSAAETRVEGFTKKDGKGFAGAMIVLLPKNPALWKALTRRDQSDSDGSFALRDVSPGDYTLVAIEDGWPLDCTSPAAMARYLAAGTSVAVSQASGKLMKLSSPVAVQER